MNLFIFIRTHGWEMIFLVKPSLVLLGVKLVLVDS